MTDKRQDFTSEVYKIEIKNIANYGFGELKKFLKKKLELNPVKIKAQPGFRDFAYLCFRNETERTDALGKLDGYVWKGKAIKASLAKAVTDPMQQKRECTAPNDRRASGKARTVLEATAPLAHLPYAEQLRQKDADLRSVLRSYRDQARRLNRQLAFPGAVDDLPCRWLGVRPSPDAETVGYRNKSEFTVGRNAAGERVVGFRLSSYVQGSVEVGGVDELPHLPERMKMAARVWQTFVRQSGHDVFSPEFYRGVHRQLTVRVSAATGDIMLVIGLHSAALTADELAALLADVRAFFGADAEGGQLAPSSVYVEHMNKRESGQLSNRVEHLLGRTHISDTLHGLRFRISPESFFQVNTRAAEVMYQCAIELGAPTARTTVLDVCCGTGTIGLCFAKYCRRVLGVEIIPQAIEDAKHNARENGVTNCEFFAGNCDDYIRKFVYENRDDDLLAVIDPPRAGLHVKSIASLRSSKGLNRFVYISCSPRAALKNWVDLARPSSKAYKGQPFVATAAVGVDMFPHTEHKEMVLLFERVPDERESEAGDVEKDAGTVDAEMADAANLVDASGQATPVESTAPDTKVEIDESLAGDAEMKDATKSDAVGEAKPIESFALETVESDATISVDAVGESTAPETEASVVKVATDEASE